MSRVFNFSAGPATLPAPVLEQAAAEMLDYHGCGMSVMEMSHRSPEFKEIIETAEADLRELMAIPDNYSVIFLQGGATLQFAGIPMNFMKKGKADYIVSGSWSKKAAKEAEKYGEVNVVASSADDNFASIPDVDDIVFDEYADYVYICQNETITGTTYHKLPDTHGIPLIADVSSMFLSEPIDVSRYDVVYGGVQKNVGPAGLCIMIIRNDLLDGDIKPYTPVYLNYKTQVEKGSLYNTPACYTIYICGLVFKWLKEQGGLEGISRRNHEKAQLLYDYLDASALFKPTAATADRSIMNVPFVTGDADLDAEFVAGAKAHGIANIKGHRSVGGMRASIYNAMTVEGVQALVDYMKEFEAAHA